MFQNLRQNNQVYILHKGDVPSMETGSVVSVSVPAPRFPSQPSFAPTTEMVVDLVVRVNGNDITYQKLPANADIADFGMNTGIVISDSREAMNSEVQSLKKRSEDIIGSVDFHRDVMAGCDKVLALLNPEYAEKKAQQEEVQSLKERMDSFSLSMERLIKMNETIMSRMEGIGLSIDKSKKKEI